MKNSSNPKRILTAFATACVLMQVSAAVGQGWTEFRGPDGTGISSDSELPAVWNEDSNIKWKTAVRGKGWSSPVVADGQIWMTTSIENPVEPRDPLDDIKTEIEVLDERADLRRKTLGDLVPKGKVSLLAICIDARTGSIIYESEVFKIADPPMIHTLNSFASPTPVIDGGFVYMSFGTFGTVCIDRNRFKTVWANQDLKFDHETGPGSSPIIWDEQLILHCDGTDKQSIVALNKATGSVLWQQNRSGKLPENGSYCKAFCTPIIVGEGAAAKIISPAAEWLYCYSATTGEELWKIPYGKQGFSNVPRPIYRDGMLYLCTGFMKSTLLAIQWDGVSTPTSEDIVWRYEKQVPTMPSPILINGRLFMVSDRGIATCLNASDGTELWQVRIKGEYSASPVYADGKIYFGNRDGLVTVIAPADEFRQIATNKMDDGLMGTPALVGNAMFIRTRKSLYRIENDSSNNK